jgi:hypothetical protein
MHMCPVRVGSTHTALLISGLAWESKGAPGTLQAPWGASKVYEAYNAGCCRRLHTGAYNPYVLFILCQSCCALFAHRLPPGQLRTAWVHIQMARAHFERMEYTRAVAAFETARQVNHWAYSERMYALRQGRPACIVTDLIIGWRSSNT